MRISLDFDGTITADPEFWSKFIRLSRDSNHEVVIVTMRIPLESRAVEQFLKEYDLEDQKVIYTGRIAKNNFYQADVWIDDIPHFVDNSAHPFHKTPIEQLLREDVVEHDSSTGKYKLKD